MWIFPRSLGVICYYRCYYQWGLQKLSQGLVLHGHTAYRYVFDLFLTQWMWSFNQRDVNKRPANQTILWNLALQIFEFFVRILLIVNGVVLINPSANMFFIRDFTVHHKDWLTYSSGTDRSGEIYNNFLLSQMTSFRWVTFLLMSLSVTLTVLFFWVFLFLMTLLFALQWLTLHWEILIMWLSRFLLTFGQNQDVMPCFIA